ncbi:unnamed protein product [Allacma fusca]|uniref:Cadherin domain-containing protein n=1 Tax=Allacma fusca TaxID=39272 RepID=A0A8J2J0S3_9HEXA|nr:unnamed protein product [Allacma fusca]
MIQHNFFGVSFCIWSSFRFAVVFAIIVHSKSDSRCFLQNGGSSLSFFVSEDAPIGYNIGSLEIQGDVTRDIILSLRESTAPVRIESGTKNLTLTRKLDKEGVEGPSTVTFTILCDKRHHNEPSIQIPITVRVIDVNDNVPKWINPPSIVNVSEQTLPGTSILTGFKAIDMDQPGPHSTLTFSALDLHGKPSNLVAFAGGGLEGRLILSRPLDYESMPTFNVTLRVKDQGTPPLYSDTNLRVQVIDSDNLNPKFEFLAYSAILPAFAKAGMTLDIEPSAISAFDQDTGINAQIQYSMPEKRPENQFLQMDPSSGRITLLRDIPEDQFNQHVTLVLKAEQVDNPDRYALSTLNIGKKGNHNAPLHFVQPEFQVNVPENSPPGTILLTVLTSRPADKNLKFAIDGDTQGIFKVGPMGQLLLRKSLDYELTTSHTIAIWVTDGYQNASTVVKLNVININDWSPRFHQSLYEFNISSDTMTKGMPLGQIAVADGDVGDKINLEIQNTDLIHVDNHGRLFAKNRTLLKREMMFLVVAKDSGDPPREAFVPVIVRLTDSSAGDFLAGDIDMKVVLIAALGLVAFSLIVGIALYFGYCRKRRKIQSENFQKRVLERNMSNPLAIHKLGGPPQGQPSTLRRSNKIRNMSMNITSPILSTATNNHILQRNSLTPVDPVNLSLSVANGTMRAKNVTWSPKLLQKITPDGTIRNGNVRVTATASQGYVSTNTNGFEVDPETSVTPVETYRSSNLQNGRNHSTDTLQSNSSLTLYF